MTYMTYQFSIFELKLSLPLLHLCHHLLLPLHLQLLGPLHPPPRELRGLLLLLISVGEGGMLDFRINM